MQHKENEPIYANTYALALVFKYILYDGIVFNLYKVIRGHLGRDFNMWSSKYTTFKYIYLFKNRYVTAGHPQTWNMLFLLIKSIY